MAHWRVFKRHFMFVSLDSLRVINKSNFFSNERKYRQLVQDYQNKIRIYLSESPIFVMGLSGVRNMRIGHIK